MPYDAYVDLPTWAKNLYSQTKGRAKARGTEFGITRDQYAALVADRCAMTGIEFDNDRYEQRHYKRPFAPSLDRIDSTIGYVQGNVRLVCVCVNLAMNAWGEDVLYRMAAGLIAQDRDVNKWKKFAGRMPEGIKLEFVGLNGPRYSARTRLAGDSERRYLGLHPSIEAAQAAIDAARATPVITQIQPTVDAGERNSLISNVEFGRRDWTRTNFRGAKRQ